MKIEGYVLGMENLFAKRQTHFIFNIEFERKIYAKRNKAICNRNFGKYL